MIGRHLKEWRYSIFWKIAGLLVATQLVTVLVAMGINMWLAYQRSLDLVEQSIRLRLDSVAEELERRTELDVEGCWKLPRSLELDLAHRFPDPVFVLDSTGHLLFQSRSDVSIPVVPDSLLEAVRAGALWISLEARHLDASWAAAPLYDEAGDMQGILVIHPLKQTVAMELSGVWQAHMRALVWAFFLVIGVAVLTGAVLTFRLVQPLRRVMHHVEAIGRGDYTSRIPREGRDELGRLVASVNRMAEQVERSVRSLREMDRVRRELMANVGHDLRTPLAALIGYLEEARFQLEKGNPDGALRALRIAQRQGDYLHRLLEDLFELSLMTGEQPPLRREPVPLAELLMDVVERYRARFEEKGVALVTNLPHMLPTIEADGLRLLRVFDNLLANALQYTEEGGYVELRATGTAGEIVIQVRDTGVGIPPEEQKHLFERYYQGTGARTRTHGGTGLGLSISKAIVEAHGGTIEVASTPGRGSVFTVRLPEPSASLI